ncbi:MAG: hypothetical protein SWH78_14710 [Thermodesulfobacteriota bacterium]|nr:hypothetical protein [Thermodesulfobacteriota bacterium]
MSVAKDDEGRIWLYFGTGRLWGRLDREEPYFSHQNAYYGIKEPVDLNNEMTYGTVGAKESTLRNVTGIRIYDYETILGGSPAVMDQNGDGKIDFSDLEEEVRAKDGWYLNYSETGERNLGQAAVLGHLVSFTTYLPSNDLCTSEGFSYLYGLYYKTGTAYVEGALLTAENNWTGRDGGSGFVLPKVYAGKGYTTTPNLHTGSEAGSVAYVQTSTGAIIDIEQVNPGVTKSGKLSWREGFNSLSEKSDPHVY